MQSREELTHTNTYTQYLCMRESIMFDYYTMCPRTEHDPSKNPNFNPGKEL